jgi:hypothetical protein
MIYFVLVATTLSTLWYSTVRWLRLVVVLCHLAVVAQFGVYLCQTGRNTFEGVTRSTGTSDTFREGVFAESHAAETFARRQLAIVYTSILCLAALALWPALAASRRPES